MEDPFAVLGLLPSATLDEVRAARRRLAKELHPDVGGDPGRMRAVNRAFDLAVKAIRDANGARRAVAEATPPADRGKRPPRPAPVRSRGTFHVDSDVPSFSIDVHPAEAFDALRAVTSQAGHILLEDPPFVLEARLREPSPCWCRFELLPEACATMVGLTVVGPPGEPAPPVDDVRDLFVGMLNRLGG